MGCPVYYRLAETFGYPDPVEITPFQCGHKESAQFVARQRKARRALHLQLEQGERENARGALEYSTNEDSLCITC